MQHLTQIVHSPVTARPVTGRTSVLIGAGESWAFLVGDCPVCDLQLTQELDAPSYSVRDRRRAFLGTRPVLCGRCKCAVWWQVERREFRPLRRRWARAR